MQDIAIIGSGGFGREVKLLLELINNYNKSFNVIGFYDDTKPKGTIVNNLPILGTIEEINNIEKPTSLVIALGEPKNKLAILKKINNKYISYPTLIAPGIHIDNSVNIGYGCIICQGVIITTDVTIGEFVTINLSCTIGHDTRISKYSSFMPSVNISGNVQIGESVYCGTGAKIIDKVTIGENTIIGAGAVVSKTLPANCTAVGIPAKPIKFH